MNLTAQRGDYRLTFAVLTVGVAAYALLQSLVTPVLPTIEKALGTSQTNVTWVLTAYLLSASVFTPVVGRLGDIYGKKRLFVVALAALAIGSLLAALASSLVVMVIARVIQGVGGGVLPLTFGIIRDEFPKEKVPGAVGMVAALASVGAGLGIVLAGPIVDAFSYHWLFWIPLMMISVAGLAAHLLIPESPVRTAGKINWFTAFLLSGWLVALLLAVSQSPTWGWGSFKVISMLVLAAVVAAAWILAESRSSNPLIDMKMMRVRTIWAANLVALLMGIGMYAALGFIPQFLQTPPEAGYGFGASVTQSGLMMLPNTIGMFLAGLAAGRLSLRFESKNLLVVGSVLTAIGYFMVAFLHSAEAVIYLAMAVVGIGFGMAFSAVSNVVVAAVAAEQTGAANGMNTNIRTIGGSLGAAFMASTVTASESASGLPTEAGYTHGFVMLAVAVGLGAVAALFIPAIRRDRTIDREKSEDLPLAPAAGRTAGGR
ncbi:MULTISPECIES: MFS transporter [unclassified Rhodococcus (in: high G+C Gram-positive bacteria)]|uniref:MFS transporter n=1 Tax=unclassified Rhodococcus (in: high G+C Gram-positive bacteria) TaxID=192944 RepID=UPI00077B1732|nr:MULTISPECIES: MFS transporter [unclassified Rhodococcus (in: high G+C Gram-positive bacteria)]KXX57447.1 MFS transporter [Rhodococcus sp. LB1]PBC57918.1 MFS transporter [Rhodococcus sp. ACPA1]